MLLFVGLGNPGSRYKFNRHNIGFMAVEQIARAYSFAPFKSRFQGVTAEGTIAGEKVILLKPETYMNESGQSVGAAARFLKIPLENIVVFQDELDLPPAKLRVKVGGGNGGHNGLRSITAHMGNDYKRIRLGIGHPGNKDLVHHYVLSDFAKAEHPWVNALCDAINEHLALLVEGKDATFQSKVHVTMNANGFHTEK